MFLPTEEGPPNHGCDEVTGGIYSSRPDLADVSIQDPELVLFTEGSSFIHEGQHQASYVIATTNEVIRAESLPQGWPE